MAAHQAPPSLGFSRQEYWSGLPFPSPMHESESEVAQLCPILTDPMDCSLLLHPWDFPGKSTGVGCHCLLHHLSESSSKTPVRLKEVSDTLVMPNHVIWSIRCLLLGRKVMTNLESIFKSRDITLPTKVHLVKAMVFPVVMYGCES